jgi:hypothetical protein
MDKAGSRKWIIALEEMLNNKLKKWDKHRKWENGEVVHILWQWEHSLIKLDIFWEDRKETVRLKLVSPRTDHDFMWHGLNDTTFNKIQDRVGNLAMGIMHPPIDPDQPVRRSTD